MLSLVTRHLPLITALMGSPLGSPNDVDAAGRAVRKMFAAVAPRYDFLNHFLSLGRDIAWRKAAARELRDVLQRRGSVALDVCCGTGDLTMALGSFSCGKVIGSDFCHPMLLLAQDKIGQARGGVSFLEADTLALPFPENALDVVATAFGFRNLADYAQGLREIRRVLRAGGIVAILEFSQVHWPFFCLLFRLYFRHVLPRLGTWISGVRGPYQYLPDSVSRFPDQEYLAVAMREAGFSKVRYRNFTGGIAALHLGEKI